MKKEFIINVEMEERWINHFASFLKLMELNGQIGHSELIAFYADGDGDFRPKFDFNINIEKEEPRNITDIHDIKFYDAG